MSKFRYMHLLGIGKKAKVSRAEEEEEETGAEEEETEEEQDDKSSKKGKKAKNANEDDPDSEEEEDDPDAEEEEDDPDAEEDDPDAEEDDENKDVKKGRKAERQRCAAIFSSKYAAGRPDLAATLAFTTRLSAKEAIRVMQTNGQAMTMTLVESSPKRKTLQERMASVKQPRIGANGGKGGDASVADTMKGLYNHYNGSDKK